MCRIERIARWLSCGGNTGGRSWTWTERWLSLTCFFRHGPHFARISPLRPYLEYSKLKFRTNAFQDSLGIAPTVSIGEKSHETAKIPVQSVEPEQRNQSTIPDNNITCHDLIILEFDDPGYIP